MCMASYINRDNRMSLHGSYTFWELLFNWGLVFSVKFLHNPRDFRPKSNTKFIESRFYARLVNFPSPSENFKNQRKTKIK